MGQEQAEGRQYVCFSIWLSRYASALTNTTTSPVLDYQWYWPESNCVVRLFFLNVLRGNVWQSSVQKWTVNPLTHWAPCISPNISHLPATDPPASCAVEWKPQPNSLPFKSSAMLTAIMPCPYCISQPNSEATAYLHAPLQVQTDLLFLARGFSPSLHPEGSSNFWLGGD